MERSLSPMLNVIGLRRGMMVGKSRQFSNVCLLSETMSPGQPQLIKEQEEGGDRG